ncbi:MAG: 50S ribosomal protein L4 [Acidobacteria bacterium]|nr:50S ribosomal protein L4 [Acidobacteriota bacterium]
MTLDILNAEHEKVGTYELPDALVAGPVKDWLIWESVVHANAAERRGTHATKNRANVSGSGRKPWRQKGTGRARVGEIRNPLWRKGGTVFGPQPRSYDYALPRKVEIAALRAALVQRLTDGGLKVVESLPAETKTKAIGEILRRFGSAGRTLVIDLQPEPQVERAVRNLARTRLVAGRRVSARDLIAARTVIVTRPAMDWVRGILEGGGAARGSEVGLSGPREATELGGVRP